MTYHIYLYLLSLLRAVIFELLESAQQHAKHSLISEGKNKVVKTTVILTLGRKRHSKSSVTSHTTQWHQSGHEQSRVHGLMQNQQSKC